MIPSIQISNGSYFNFELLNENIFGIEDIAHALSQICRFTGHTREFYSVAQHSVLVSKIVPEKYQLVGLLHDAAEAFLGDVSAPLKTLLPDYREVERRVESAVLWQYGIMQIPECVKKADLTLLLTEQRDLMPRTELKWDGHGTTQLLEEKIVPLPPEEARRLFLRRFYHLADGDPE